MRCYVAHRSWAFIALRTPRKTSARLRKKCKKRGHLYRFRDGFYKRECINCGHYQMMFSNGSWGPDE